MHIGVDRRTRWRAPAPPAHRQSLPSRRAHGQSTACPAIASTSPIEAEAGASSARHECAAFPANSARAAAPRTGAPGDRTTTVQPARTAPSTKDAGAGARDAESPAKRSSWRLTNGSSSLAHVTPSLPGWRRSRTCSATAPPPARRPERSGQRQRCGDPFEPVAGQSEPAEDRRCRSHRVNRAADVVREAGQRQRQGAAASADRGIPVEHDHRQAGETEHGRRGEAVRTCAHDRDVIPAAVHDFTARLQRPRAPQHVRRRGIRPGTCLRAPGSRERRHRQSRNFAGGIRSRGSARRQAAGHAPADPFEPAQRLAGEDVQSHRDERSVRRVEDRRRPGDPDQALAEDLPRVADDGQLRVVERRSEPARRD